MNLVIYTEAQDKTASAVVSMTDTTPLTELEQLVLGDTPLISVTFTDGSAAPAWAGQASYTMSLALGTPDGDGRLDYTQIQAETAITGGWEGNLPLDTPALVTALNLLVNQGATILRPPTQRYTYQAPRFAWFVLQIAVRGPDGYLTTYASLRVCVLNRVITSNFSEQPGPDAEYFQWVTDQLAAKANLASPTFTGIPAAPTAAADTDTTQIATTAFVLGQASDAVPLINGTAAAGTSEKYARGDHVHPTDTTRAPLASPTFTGTPAAPTAAVDTSTTQLATTAYVTSQGYLKSETAATTYQPLDSDLTAIAALSSNGIVTRTGTGTAAARTITGTAGQVAVTNGDGVSGNPTLSLPTALTSVNSITAAAATDLTLAGGTAGTNAVKVTNTTAATTTTTGAFQVGTNVGLSGNTGGPSFLGGALTVGSSINIPTASYIIYNSIAYFGAGSAVGANVTDLGIRADNALALASGGANIRLSFASGGAATFTSGSTVSIANTTATALQSAGGIVSTSGTAGLGYGTGAGGAVTQITSRTTGVTLNKVAGAITLFTAAGSATAASFTVTNSAVAATDVVHLSVKSATNKYLAFVTATGAGSFEITFYTTGGTVSDAPVFNFAVIKAVAA